MGQEQATSAGAIPEQVIADLEAAADGALAAQSVADPLASLSAAARLERVSRTLAAQAAVAAIAAGMSWRDIGGAYGISKQAAHQRFARHVRHHGRAAP